MPSQNESNQDCYWTCPVCCAKMKPKDREPHLKGTRHRNTLLQLEAQKNKLFVKSEPVEIPSTTAATAKNVNPSTFLSKETQRHKDKINKLVQEFLSNSQASVAQEIPKKALPVSVKKVDSTPINKAPPAPTKEAPSQSARRRKATNVKKVTLTPRKEAPAVIIKEPPSMSIDKTPPAPINGTPRFKPGARFPTRTNPDLPAVAQTVRKETTTKNKHNMPSKISVPITAPRQFTPGVPFYTQAQAPVRPKYWCSMCKTWMSMTEWKTHLNDGNHLKHSASTGKAQVTTPLPGPIIVVSPVPTKQNQLQEPGKQDEPLEKYGFDGWSGSSGDDTSVVSQETSSCMTNEWSSGDDAPESPQELSSFDDDIWTLQFRESHQAGIKHLEQLENTKRWFRSSDSIPPSRKFYRLRSSNVYTGYRTIQNPQPPVHPNGQRKIRVYQIPAIYNVSELPSQAWMDAFIALPEGIMTLITPAEYELACYAFSTSGQVYTIDTQWDDEPLDGDYIDTTQWYGSGLYDFC